MKASTRLLARGWRRGARAWYRGTTAVLAAALVVLLTAGGVLSGAQQETQGRVADFYTGALRLTVAGTGAVPDATFQVPDAMERLDLDPDDVRVQFESQAVLTRRTVVGAAFEREGFDLDTPGGQGGRGAVALSAMVGIDLQDPAALRALEPHMVNGGLPARTDGAIPLLLSLDRLERFLSPEERAQMPWPPQPSDLADLRFQVTAARMDNDTSLAEGGMIIYRNAYVAGLYRTGIDFLDGFTVVAPIGAVRDLHGLDREDPVANVLLVDHGQQTAGRRAAEEGWTSQGASAFTHQYLGQVMDVLRVFGTFAILSLFLLPAFLIVHGVTRQLEAHNREIAVCQAIGVPPQEIRGALGWLVVRMGLSAVVLAVSIVVGLALVFQTWLPGVAAAPLPLGFRLDWGTVLLALVLTIGSVGAALAIAFRSHARLQTASALRTF